MNYSGSLYSSQLFLTGFDLFHTHLRKKSFQGISFFCLKYSLFGLKREFCQIREKMLKNT